jgi:hypothetical protein
MDFRAQNGPKRAWARTGALILFLVTGVLLVTSLNSTNGQFLSNHSTSGTFGSK